MNYSAYYLFFTFMFADMLDTLTLQIHGWHFHLKL